MPSPCFAGLVFQSILEELQPPVNEGADASCFPWRHLNYLWVALESSRYLQTCGTPRSLPFSLAPLAIVQDHGATAPWWCHLVGGALQARPLNMRVCCRGWSPCWHAYAHLPGLFADCSQPLDVVLLLDGSSGYPASYFDEMKSFAKAFISKANLGEWCACSSRLGRGSFCGSSCSKG